MPLIYEQDIDLLTKLGVWHIEEAMDFFLSQVPLKPQISHPHKQLQHLAGRYLLKVLYPDFPYGLIRIADTKKPFLEDEKYHFSISHCGDFAAVIVSSTQRAGVDIELISPKVASIQHKFLSLKEKEIISIAEKQYNMETGAGITLAWSIKEALFKWYGEGQVDFKRHLHINSIGVQNNTGVAHCSFLKHTTLPLEVHFFILNNHAVSWVISKEIT